MCFNGLKINKTHFKREKRSLENKKGFQMHFEQKL
jgi:hypothetical protein